MIEPRDVLIFIPLSLLYNMFFHKMTELIYKNALPKERFNKSIALLLTLGILSYVIVFILIPDRPEYNDPNIRLGIFLGGSMLIMSAIVNNWDNMSEISKLVSMGLIIGCILSYTYEWVDIERFTLIE